MTIYKQGHLLRQTKTLGVSLFGLNLVVKLNSFLSLSLSLSPQRLVKRYCSIEDHKLFMTKNKEVMNHTNTHNSCNHTNNAS